MNVIFYILYCSFYGDILFPNLHLEKVLEFYFFGDLNVYIIFKNKYCLVIMFLKTIIENTDNLKNSSLFFKFNVFYIFLVKKLKTTHFLCFPYFLE